MGAARQRATSGRSGPGRNGSGSIAGCFNDLAAIGAISKLRELGLDVPGDVSGFDDIAIARHVFPALTTATSPRDELGRQAWELLHASLDQRRPAEAVKLLPAALVTRQSTGIPKTR